MKEFTYKEVAILVLALVAVFAFLQTSSSIWTLAFWREFLLKLVVYGAVIEVVVIILGSFKRDKG